MSTQEIADAVMGLPEKDRLDLARRIVADIAAEREIAGEIARAVKGIEDVVAGRVRGLSEKGFRDALK
jgi:RNA-splicing ligase RtcB